MTLDFVESCGILGSTIFSRQTGGLYPFKTFRAHGSRPRDFAFSKLERLSVVLYGPYYNY